MNFLKRLWRKWFGVKTGVYYSNDEVLERIEWAIANKDRLPLIQKYERVEINGWSTVKETIRHAYDPHEDPEKVMSGEVESYFE